MSKLKTMMAVALFGSFALPMTGHTAALINNAIIPGINEFEDTDAERVARSDGEGGVTFVTSGSLEVGDVIQTALRFNTANSNQIFLIPGLAPPYQLTAYSELQVAALFDPGTTNPCASTTTCDIIFAPTGNLGANVFASVYENAAGTLNNLSDPPATGIAKAQSGNLVATLGLGEADDFWVVFDGLIDLTAAAAVQPGDPQVPTGIFGLSVLSDPGAVPFVPNGITGADGNLHDLVGNVSAFQRGPGVNEGWLLSTNTTVDFFVAVPEPGSLALLGLTLLCMGAVSKGRGRKV
jgi:hypothetical protein